MERRDPAPPGTYVAVGIAIGTGTATAVGVALGVVEIGGVGGGLGLVLGLALERGFRAAA